MKSSTVSRNVKLPATEYLANLIKGWSEQGYPAAQQFYSAFKVLQLSDDCEQPHPEVLAFLDQLRFALMANGAMGGK